MVRRSERRSCADGIIAILDDVAPDNQGLLLIVKVYLDKGEKPLKGDGIVTVCSVTFTPTKYRQFKRVWVPMLKEWGADAFHATDFYNGGDKFWRKAPGAKQADPDLPHLKERFDRHCRSIPTMIGANAAHITAIAFRPEEYLQVSSEAFRATYGSSVHSIAAQLVLITNGWWAKDIGYRNGFAGFMESGDDDQGLVESAVARLRSHPTAGPLVQLSSFTSIDKGKAVGLEASDCVAWHWNKYYADYFRHGKENEARKDFAAMMEIAEERVYMSIITGDKLMVLLTKSPLGSSAVADAV